MSTFIDSTLFLEAGEWLASRYALSQPDGDYPPHGLGCCYAIKQAQRARGDSAYPFNRIEIFLEEAVFPVEDRPDHKTLAYWFGGDTVENREARLMAMAMCYTLAESGWDVRICKGEWIPYRK